jgi:hypothetical protein
MTALAGSGLFLTALTANAQYQPRQDYPYQTQDRRDARMFDQVRGDLDLAATTALPTSGDRSRVAIAREQVTGLQRAIENGEADRLTFGETTSAIQRVVDLNRLTDRDRSYLVNDMNQLRDLQARLEH